MKEVHYRNVLCKAENGDVRRRRSAQISKSSLYSIRINANWNQQNVTRMFQKHLHILGMVYLATVAWIIQLVSGRGIRIAE